MTLKYFKLTLISLTVIGCTTVALDEATYDIVVHEQKPNSNCQNLGMVVGEESGFGTSINVNARSKMLNSTAELHPSANYIQIIQTEQNLLSSKYVGVAYKCITNADLSESELKEGCDKNDASSCFDYAYRLATDKKFNQADIPLDKACKLGHQEACDIQTKYKRDLKNQKIFSELNRKCTSGNGKSCLELAFIAYNAQEVNSAIYWAQRACLKKNSEGCKFYSKLMDEKTNRENANRQEQALQQQQLVQQEQLRLQRAAMIEQMRQNSNNNWGNALQQLSDSHNEQQRQQPTQKTNCVTRSRLNWYGNTEYYTDCSSSP